MAEVGYVERFARQVFGGRPLIGHASKAYDFGVFDWVDCYVEAIDGLAVDFPEFQDALDRRVQELTDRKRPEVNEPGLRVFYEHGINSCVRAAQDFPADKDTEYLLAIKKRYKELI